MIDTLRFIVFYQTVGVDKNTLDCLLMFLYSGKVTVTQSNLFALLMAADYLQFALLESECVKIIEKEVLSKQNIINIRQQFEHIHSLVVVIDKWIAKKFAIEEFKQLIVSHRGNMREETLKSIATRWIQEVKNARVRQQFEEQYALFLIFLVLRQQYQKQF